ncbi:MAG: diguanylate cyclase [Dehalococcoidia bacterium]|nr:diguanylate cyclase [Dehalococcoidia bacterium]
MVIPLIACIAYVPLALVLLSNRPWGRQHKLLVSFVVAAFAWSLTDFVARSDYLLDDKRLLSQIVISVAILAIVQFYYFMRCYFSKSVTRMPIAYAFVIACIAMCILEVIPTSVVVTSEGLTVHYGLPLLVLSAIMLVSLAGNALASLFRCYRQSTEAAERNQFLYLLLATTALSLFVLSSFMPSGGSYPIAHVGNLLVAGILSYAVVAHRLLDIRVFMRRGIVLVGLYGGGIVILLLLLGMLHVLFGVRYDPVTVLLVVGLGVPLIFLFTNVVRDALKRKVEQLFVGDQYEVRQEMFEFFDRIYDVPTLEQFGVQLVSLLARSVDAVRAYLLLPDGKEGDFVVHFAYPRASADGEDITLTVNHDSPLLTWLKREGQFLPVRFLSILPEFQSLWKRERDDVHMSQVELFMPVENGGEVVGILAVGAKARGKPYLVEDIELMRTAASRVAASMEKQYLYEQLQKQETELTLLNTMALVVSSSLDIQDIFMGFSSELRKVVPLDYAAVALVDDDRIRLHAVYGDVAASEIAQMSHSLQGTATEWICQNRKSVYQPDIQASTSYWPDTHYVREGIRSVAHLPLIVRGEVMGTLIVASGKADVYREADIHLLEQVARQIATPIENATLYARAEQRSRIDELTGLFNRRHFEERLREEVARHSRHDGFFSLLMVDLDYFKAHNDMYGHPSGDKLLRLVGSLIGYSIRDTDQAFRYGGDEFTVILPHTSSEEAFVVAERVRARIAREMEAKQSTVTCSIGLASYPADGVMFGELVSTADAALYYAKNTGGNRTYLSSKIFSEVETNPEPGGGGGHRGSGLSAVYALAAAVDVKDHYTYGHSRKVNTYAVVLAEALGLPSGEVSRISTSALLHDIGKIGIPDRILNKKGDLDADEWEAIKSHPRLGANIVGNVPDLAPCVGNILYHHERWDGTGYPEGLRGKSIPIGARILAIADSFAAMASVRPYREALSDAEALERLRQNAGSQFDPDLLDAFIKEVEAGLPRKDSVSKVPPI